MYGLGLLPTKLTLIRHFIFPVATTAWLYSGHMVGDQEGELEHSLKRSKDFY